MFPNGFDKNLAMAPKIDLNHFNPIMMQPYTSVFLASNVKTKRMETEYVNRDSNRLHDKDEEFIWKDKHSEKQVGQFHWSSIRTSNGAIPVFDP